MLLNNLKDVLTEGEICLAIKGRIEPAGKNGLEVNGLTAWLEVEKVVAVDKHKTLVFIKD